MLIYVGAAQQGSTRARSQPHWPAAVAMTHPQQHYFVLLLLASSSACPHCAMPFTQLLTLPLSLLLLPPSPPHPPPPRSMATAEEPSKVAAASVEEYYEKEYEPKYEKYEPKVS